MDIIAEIFARAAASPEHIAHRTGNTAVTYRHLVGDVRRTAAFIQAMCGHDRSPVVIVGHKEPEMLIGFLGSILSGRAYAPVDTIMPPDRLAQIVASLGAKAVLTPSSIREACTEKSEKSSVDLPLPTTPLAFGDPFYIMFTSGSTGAPKGVVVTHGNLLDFLDWIFAEQHPRLQQEVVLNQAPFSFDLSILDIYLALITGGTLVSITRDEIASPLQLFRSLETAAPTIWVSTPSFAQLCVQEPRFAAPLLPTLQKFIFCGETLPGPLARELLSRFPAQIWNIYGPTEATVATTSIRIDSAIVERYPALPIGTSKPRSRLIAVDESRRPVPEGERGELIITGPNVAAGYLNNPEKTAQVFFTFEGEAAYATGDWGYSKDGLMFCEGRRDSQIKFHGYRIELGDIEANLQSLPELRDAVVIPKRRDSQIEYLAAFVIRANGVEVSDHELSRAIKIKLSARIPSYMVPQRIHVVEAFPLNANGKADRKALALKLA